MHLSDCSLYLGLGCDCGDLDLTVYAAHCYVPTFIASTGRFGFFIDHMGGECFIEAHELPALTLAAIASASHLPDAHDVIAILRAANGVDLNHAKETIISKLKAFTASQCLASS